MNKILFTTISTIWFLSFSLCISCSKEDGHADPLNVYHYQDENMTLNANSHEIILDEQGEGDEYSQELPKDWDWWHIQEMWSDIKDPNGNPTWAFIYDGVKKTANSVSYDWIKFEKIPGDKFPYIKITVQENNTGELRGVRIYFKTQPSEHRIYTGEIVVIQKPKPDMESYTMKIRYKGKVYSTEAHLNINEEVIFENQEFANVMNLIESKDKVEALIMDDEIVDYFDDEDLAKNKTLSNLSKKIDSLTPIEYNRNLLLTRASDAFRYMTAGSLGYCALYDDSGFNDSHIYKNLQTADDSYDVINMGSENLNDKVSSLAVGYNGNNGMVCAVLTIWEDKYFNHGDDDRTKHRISIVASLLNPKVSRDNLKNIKCIGSSNSWNDRISSFSFHFGYYGSDLKDY